MYISMSSIALSLVLAQLGKGSVDHLIAFVSWKFSTIEKINTTNERESVAIVYVL